MSSSSLWGSPSSSGESYGSQRFYVPLRALASRDRERLVRQIERVAPSRSPANAITPADLARRQPRIWLLAAALLAATTALVFALPLEFF